MLREIFPSILLCSQVCIKRKLFTCVEVFVFMGLGTPSVSHLQENPLVHEPPFNIMWKTLNRSKEMNAVSTKVLLQCFPPVCPFAPQACFGLVTSYNTACLALVTS
jgi:hypothetical protein